MSKIFKASLVVLLVVIIGSITVSKKKPEAPRLGLSQENEGREHIKQEESRDYKNKIPTSGPHANPVTWGISDKELENKNIIHNMEHGGIVVSYNADLPSSDVDNLKKLFSKPYSVEDFRPTKAVIMPKKDQEKPLVLSSWDRTYELDGYDQAKIIEYYKTNIGRSPEPKAQ